MNRQRHHFFAPCPRGLEALLEAELRALGGDDVDRTPGGVGFTGTLETCYRANLESRLASRILWRVGRRRYRDEQDVYDAARQLEWPAWFTVARSIRVDVSASRSPLRSLDFATLRIKDAVCDRFREVTGGRRPDVDTRGPDVRIHAFLDARSISLYLDTSGEPLYKRGYRRAPAEAPLKENLAAGIVALSGWNPDEPLIDPMCGSGTLLTEAAMMALGRAPGMGRSFGFERLIGFDRALWEAVRARARAAERPAAGIMLYGSDLDAREVEHARVNLRAAGLEPVVKLKQARATDLRPPPETRGHPGVIVMNPPYGVRLGEQQALLALYAQLGDWLKRHFAGWRACIFSGDPALARAIRLHASRRTPLYNGPIECRLYEYRIVAGSMRRAKREPESPTDGS